MVPRVPSGYTAGLHEPDGVHLETKGYVYMWDKARRIAGLAGPAPVTTASAPADSHTSARAASPPAPAAPFALAAAPDSGGSGWQEPKIYVLHVKRPRPDRQQKLTWSRSVDRARPHLSRRQPSKIGIG